MPALKIFSIEQIRSWDKYTIESEAINSIDLMERAAKACHEFLLKEFNDSEKFIIVCGPGNNGGDGLAIARMLATEGKNVKVFVCKAISEFSEDFLINEKRLKEQGKVKLIYLEILTDFPDLNEDEVIIDALFGSGLNKEPEGLAAKLINKINTLENNVVSVDIPSGLFGDNTSHGHKAIIKADITLSFQTPKFAFLFPENEAFVGNWKLIDIGLSNDFYKRESSDSFLLNKGFISGLIKPRRKFAHKGNFGHTLLICGSYGKIGAAVMAASAALRSGCGLLTVHLPSCGVSILQTSLPEAMLMPDKDEFLISGIKFPEKFSSIGIGPGIGTSVKTAKALYELLSDHKRPLVIDADALNILSENRELIKYIPEQSILTPHIKEFERLVGKCSDDFERYKKQIEFSKERKVFIVLKGKYSCLSSPEGISYFNDTGNSGMAKGGSGDILTGLLSGILAQGYSPRNASLLGIYIHGLAGDIAAEKYGQTAMKAGDIIEMLPMAFKQFENIK